MFYVTLKYIDEHLYKSDDLSDVENKKIDDIFISIGINKKLIQNNYLTLDFNFNEYVKTNFKHMT